jgi:GR25 family glycosyltransferase involved in LPS biosynthesis
MTYRGLYINLDRSTDRRAEMEAEMARVGLKDRYQRLSATDGQTLSLLTHLNNKNEAACFLSHVAALKSPLDGNPHRHIIEDDVIFAARAGVTLDKIVNSNAMNAYDILYTDLAIPLSSESLRPFKARFDNAIKRDTSGIIASVVFDIMPLKDVAFTGASSYLVNREAISKLTELYDAEINAGIRLPVDDFLRLQGQIGALRVGCLFPFVTSVRVEHTISSTVRKNPDASRRFTAANLARYSFFVDCDYAECERLLKTHIPSPAADDHHTQLLSSLLGFALTLPEA